MKNPVMLIMGIIILALGGVIIINAQTRVLGIQQNFLNQKPEQYTLTYWTWFQVKEYNFNIKREGQDFIERMGMQDDKEWDYYFKDKIIMEVVNNE